MSRETTVTLVTILSNFCMRSENKPLLQGDPRFFQDITSTAVEVGLGMGGLFISVSDPPPMGTKLRLSFEVPGGNVQAEAIVRNIVPGEGMGVEFKKLRLKDRILLEKLLKRLLQ
jgi:PilZ domain